VRVGRFLSVNPLTKKYPELILYQFASNTSIMAIDLDGLEAMISTYGAGIHIINGEIAKSTDESQFKKESGREVEWGTACQSYSVHTGKLLIKALEQVTKDEGSIEYLSIYSHSSNVNVILDNGQYGNQSFGLKSKWTGYTYTSLNDVFSDDKIKFTDNALIILAGCNSGSQLMPDRKTKTGNVASYITSNYGIATIGAEGETSPRGENGVRKADYDYTLYYKNENGDLMAYSLGKELNKGAINKAKDIVNKNSEKIRAKQNSDETKSDETNH